MRSKNNKMRARARLLAAQSALADGKSVLICTRRRNTAVTAETERSLQFLHKECTRGIISKEKAREIFGRLPDPSSISPEEALVEKMKKQFSTSSMSSPSSMSSTNHNKKE